MAGTMKRILDHLIYPPWRVRRAFPAKTLKAIEDAVAASESLHRGELRFVVEAGLSFSELWRGKTARQRALAVFSDLHVWDTEDNSGVLIYVLIWVALLPLGLGMIVLIPVLAGTLHASYQDVFGERPALPPAAAAKE